MGLEIAAAIIGGIAEAAKVGSQEAAADAQTQALELQAAQQRLQYQQKTLSNYDVMQKVLDAQTAQMSVSGAAFSSPSFNAIQRASENIGARQQLNLNTEEDIAQNNINLEKQNVRSKLYAQLFGDATDIGMKAFSLYSGMPTKGV